MPGRMRVGRAGRMGDGGVSGDVRSRAVRTRAAVMREPEADWEIVELDLVDPGPGEVLVGAEDGSVVGTWEDLADC